MGLLIVLLCELVREPSDDLVLDDVRESLDSVSLDGLLTVCALSPLTLVHHQTVLHSVSPGTRTPTHRLFANLGSIDIGSSEWTCIPPLLRHPSSHCLLDARLYWQYRCSTKMKHFSTQNLSLACIGSLPFLLILFS
jgi:hypothetical protein